MKVVIVTLSTGQQLITEVQAVEVDGNQFLRFVNPCLVMSSMAGPDQVNAQLVPVALFAKDRTLAVAEQHIVLSGEPTEEALAAYSKFVSPSQIVTPPEKQLIIPQ